MILNNINIYAKDRQFHKGYIRLHEGIISEVALDASLTQSEAVSDTVIIDGHADYCMPGFIDIHTHGCNGYDFCDGTSKALDAITDYEASIGVTAIAPATMTLPVSALQRILKNAANYCKSKQSNSRAEIIGINMEGPFISPLKMGAQDGKNILKPDISLARSFIEASEGLVKIIGIAPEEDEGSYEYIASLSKEVIISLAHTNASYDEAMRAIDAGASHAVHLYNAMSSISARNPGTSSAVIDSNNVTAELICDGVHIHPAMVRQTFKLLDNDRLILISDSIRATGLCDGIYDLGGQDVIVKEGKAVLKKDGSIAGSCMSLPDCVRTAVINMNLPLEMVIPCVTSNPAKLMGVYDRMGSLEKGKNANLVLWNKNLELDMVLLNGHIK